MASKGLTCRSTRFQACPRLTANVAKRIQTLPKNVALIQLISLSDLHKNNRSFLKHHPFTPTSISQSSSILINLPSTPKLSSNLISHIINLILYINLSSIYWLDDLILIISQTNILHRDPLVSIDIQSVFSSQNLSSRWI